MVVGVCVKLIGSCFLVSLIRNMVFYLRFLVLCRVESMIVEMVSLLFVFL